MPDVKVKIPQVDRGAEAREIRLFTRGDFWRSQVLLFQGCYKKFGNNCWFPN